MKERVRHPRWIGRNKILLPFNKSNSDGQNLLFVIDEGSYYKENVYYVWQYISQKFILLISSKQFILLTLSEVNENKKQIRWDVPIEEVTGIKISKNNRLFVCGEGKRYLIPTNSAEEQYYLYFKLSFLYDQELTNNTLLDHISNSNKFVFINLFK